MRGPVHIIIEKLREADPARRAPKRSPEISLEHLLETKRAFDSVAADYDGPIGNNALIQTMRRRLWREVERHVPAGGRLLDLGCGTGLDAVHFAELGYQVVATDWSPQMVLKTGQRVGARNLRDRVTVQHLGIQEIDQLGDERFDGIYSDLGPLNCAPKLEIVAKRAAQLLNPGGTLVASVIGRTCPWEWAYYTARGHLHRARIRGAERAVAVGLNERTVWTRYYSPREFAATFAPYFTVKHYEGMLFAAPPPYLIDLHSRLGRLGRVLLRLDERIARWPVARDSGDHFLMVLTKRR
ncbi:MAG: class I SAM-dependent methyltransferase [Chloroflexia bacterium]